MIFLPSDVASLAVVGLDLSQCYNIGVGTFLCVCVRIRICIVLSSPANCTRIACHRGEVSPQPWRWTHSANFYYECIYAYIMRFLKVFAIKSRKPPLVNDTPIKLLFKILTWSAWFWIRKPSSKIKNEAMCRSGIPSSSVILWNCVCVVDRTFGVCFATSWGWQSSFSFLFFNDLYQSES